MLDLIGIWEIWRPGGCLARLVTCWGPLQWGVYLVSNGVLGWWCVTSGIRMNAGTQSYPAEHGWSLCIFLLPPDLFTNLEQVASANGNEWIDWWCGQIYMLCSWSDKSCIYYLWSITEIRGTSVINFRCGLICRHLKIAIDDWLFQMCVDLDEMLITLSCYCKNSNEGALVQG